jgi:hypothetical protein
MAKNPTLDDMRLALSKVMPLHKREANKAKFLESSKVKNRLYHGTGADITEFKPGEKTKSVFLSHDPYLASSFAENRSATSNGSPNVMPVHVNVQNPWDYENPEHVQAVVNELNKKKDHFGAPAGMEHEPKLHMGKWSTIESHAIQKAIKKLGHDSFYVKEGQRKNLGVYNPNQIKSAIGNRGTYDVNDPDITKAKGGNVKKASNELRLFHGTSGKPFNEFKGTTWLSNSPNVASTYANKHTVTPRVIPVHARLKNPLEVHAYEENYGVLPLNLTVHGKNGRSTLQRELELHDLDPNEDFIDSETVASRAKKLGYDGVIFRNMEDTGAGQDADDNPYSDVYAVFDPRKIKSAITGKSKGKIPMAKGGSVMGINVKSDTKAGRSYADLIVDGHKKYESRNADSLRPYVGKRVAIVRTGEGKAKAIGEVTIGEPMVVDKKKFRAMEEHHHVPEGSAFDINTPTKHLYPMHNPVRYDKEKDVGHGIVSRKVIHEAKGGSVEPKKTVKAYKLFRVHEKHPGKLFPLFVDANTPVEMGKWINAKEGEMANGKVKSKIGNLAFRPGWHAGDVPVATHIGEKSDPSLTAPDTRPENHAWAEVEMPNDVDWQSEANRRGMNAQGKLIPVKAHITDQLPVGGHYRYKTNPNMTGNWLIGGSMKVNKILTDAEVAKINKAHGLADLPRAQKFNKKRFGFAKGGVVAPEAWVAEEHVNHGAQHGGIVPQPIESHLGNRDVPSMQAWIRNKKHHGGITHAHHLEIEERPL